MTRQEVLDEYQKMPEYLRNGLYDSFVIAVCRDNNNRFALKTLEDYVNKYKSIDMEA